MVDLLLFDALLRALPPSCRLILGGMRTSSRPSAQAMYSRT